MELGQFRKFTKDLPDDMDIVIFYHLSEEDSEKIPVDIPISFVRLEDKKNISGGRNNLDGKRFYSDKVICVEGPDKEAGEKIALEYFNSQRNNPSSNYSLNNL